MPTELKMRNWRYVLAIGAVLSFASPTLAPAGSFTQLGQFTGAVSPVVSSLLARFPAGGPGLRAAVAQLLEAIPFLADDVVFAARTANLAQRQAIGAGLADASNYFAKCSLDSCRAAQALIRTAMNFADSDTRAGIILAEVPTLPQGIPGFDNAGATTGGCAVVSPSRPNC